MNDWIINRFRKCDRYGLILTKGFGNHKDRGCIIDCAAAIRIGPKIGGIHGVGGCRRTLNTGNSDCYAACYGRTARARRCPSAGVGSLRWLGNKSQNTNNSCKKMQQKMAFDTHQNLKLLSHLAQKQIGHRLIKNIGRPHRPRNILPLTLELPDTPNTQRETQPRIEKNDI